MRQKCHCSNPANSAETCMPRPPGIPVNGELQSQLSAAILASGLKREDLAAKLALQLGTFEEYFTREDRKIPPKKLEKLRKLLGLNEGAVFTKSDGHFSASLRHKLRAVSKHQEDCSIEENLRDFEDAIYRKDGHAAHEIAYTLSDEYRYQGDYASSLQWLGISESHIAAFSKGNTGLSFLRTLKIDFKRTLVREFIWFGALKETYGAYNVLIKRAHSAGVAYSNFASDFAQIILNCRRQLAELARLRGDYSNAFQMFSILHQEYGEFYDASAQKYCKLGMIECDRMLDSSSVIEQIDNLARVQSKSENIRLQARMNRIRFQANRWRTSIAGDRDSLMRMDHSGLLNELDRIAESQKNRVSRLYLAFEQISLRLELYGRGILHGDIPETLIQSLVALLKRCADQPNTTMPMEAAHANLLLCEAYLIRGNIILSINYLEAAEAYYSAAGLGSGISRCNYARSLFPSLEKSQNIKPFEGVDYWYSDQTASKIETWSISLTANLP